MMADCQKPVHDGGLAFMSRWLTPAQRGADVTEARAFDPAPYLPQPAEETTTKAPPAWLWFVAGGLFAAAVAVASC